MFRPRREKVNAKLAQVRSDLASHPYNSPQIKQATALIEQLRPHKTSAEIDAELGAKGLPSLAECGKVTARGLVSFARLNRRRVKLEAQLARA